MIEIKPMLSGQCERLKAITEELEILYVSENDTFDLFFSRTNHFDELPIKPIPINIELEFDKVYMKGQIIHLLPKAEQMIKLCSNEQIIKIKEEYGIAINFMSAHLTLGFISDSVATISKLQKELPLKLRFTKFSYI